MLQAQRPNMGHDDGTISEDALKAAKARFMNPRCKAKRIGFKEAELHWWDLEYNHKYEVDFFSPVDAEEKYGTASLTGLSNRGGEGLIRLHLVIWHDYPRRMNESGHFHHIKRPDIKGSNFRFAIRQTHSIDEKGKPVPDPKAVCDSNHVNFLGEWPEPKATIKEKREKEKREAAEEKARQRERKKAIRKKRKVKPLSIPREVKLQSKQEIERYKANVEKELKEREEQMGKAAKKAMEEEADRRKREALLTKKTRCSCLPWFSRSKQKRERILAAAHAASETTATTARALAPCPRLPPG